jgi:hypothetical protein
MCKKLCVVANGMVHTGGVSIAILYNNKIYWICCYGWRIDYREDAQHIYVRDSIMHTRGEALRLLDVIIDNFRSISGAIAALLPQPLHEEIIPQIHMLDEVIGMLTGGRK